MPFFSLQHNRRTKVEHDSFVMNQVSDRVLDFANFDLILLKGAVSSILIITMKSQTMNLLSMEAYK